MNKLPFSDALRIYTNPLDFAIYIHGNDGEPKCFFSISELGMTPLYVSKHIGTKQDAILALEKLLESIIGDVEKISTIFPQILSQNICPSISVGTHDPEPTMILTNQLKQKIIDSLQKQWKANMNEIEWRKKWAA